MCTSKIDICTLNIQISLHYSLHTCVVHTYVVDVIELFSGLVTYAGQQLSVVPSWNLGGLTGLNKALDLHRFLSSPPVHW